MFSFGQQILHFATRNTVFFEVVKPVSAVCFYQTHLSYTNVHVLDKQSFSLCLYFFSKNLLVRIDDDRQRKVKGQLWTGVEVCCLLDVISFQGFQ